MNGLLVLDKPAGITSRDALNRVQKWFPRKTKIGHTGTLDPLATGVLVVCLGMATRLAEFVQAMGKSYDSRFRLGATSSTDDADGIVQFTDAKPRCREEVDAVFDSFRGTIEQFPPSVSALKIGGKRAHDLARTGREVPLAARTVRVDSIRVQSFEWPFLDVSIDCGKGTYIRSIARDLGAKLGIGGIVETLRRTRVGPFTVQQSVTLDATKEDAAAKVLPMTAALAGMREVRITSEEETRLRCGQTIGDAISTEPEEVTILDERGGLIGIGVIETGLRPRIVLVPRSGK